MRKQLDPKTVAKIRKMYLIEKKSAKAVADKFKVSQFSVYKWCGGGRRQGGIEQSYCW